MTKLNKTAEPQGVGLNDLLCCPFCGTPAHSAFAPSMRNDGTAHWVECPCGARTGDFGGPKSAANAWNKRAA